MQQPVRPVAALVEGAASRARGKDEADLTAPETLPPEEQNRKDGRETESKPCAILT